MRVLITGSTSVLGRAIGGKLSSWAEVLYAGRHKADVFFDMLSPDFSAFHSLKADIVVHAASAFGGNSPEDFFHCAATNIQGMLNTVRLCEQVKAKRIIVISSIFADYKNNYPLYNTYSLSKKQADELACLYSSISNIKTVILRLSQVYDSKSLCKKHQNLFYHIVEKCKKGEDISIFGTNDALRNYIFIEDVAEIVSRAATGDIRGVYYCTAPKSIRLSTVARIGYRVFKTSGRVHFLPDKPDIPDLPSFSGKTLFKAVNFTPRVSIEQGLRMIAKEERQ